MRIGVFGGSFDPVHYGHLLLAERCREHGRLDEVRFMPACIPPHKQGQGRADDHHRMAMLDLAIGGHRQLVASDIELARGGVSYTVDTLGALQSDMPDDELFLLMGADSLIDFPTWRQPARICELADLIVVERPGHVLADFEVLSAIASPHRIARYRDLLTPMPQMDISSTDIRRRVADGQSIRFQTPRAVEAYIFAEGLYRESRPKPLARSASAH